MTRTVRILDLYPHQLNIYGDRGNLLTLQRRAQWAGLGCEVIRHRPGDRLPTGVDLVLGGGGQDSGQRRVLPDLQAITPDLRAMADDGVPMLVICGMYQLFGQNYVTADGQELTGTGILDVTTRAGSTRLVGNLVAHSEEFGELVGYENHSGQTTLGPGAEPLAQVVTGMGNNGTDRGEGARHGHVLGSYLHGPLLPKNPAIADWLLATAVSRWPVPVELAPVSDAGAAAARAQSRTRPR